MNLVSWPRRGGAGKIGADVLHAACGRRAGYTVCNWRIPVRRARVTYGQGAPTCKQCLRILAVRVKRQQFQERGVPDTPEASLAAERAAALKRALKKARRGPSEEQVRAAVRKFVDGGGVIKRIEARTLIAALEGRG